MSNRYNRNRTHRTRKSTKTRFWNIGKRNKNNEIIGSIIVVTLIGGGAWSSLSRSSQALLVVLLVFMVILLFAVVFGFVAFLAYQHKQRLRALTSSQVDAMDPYQFEHYVAALLERQGYTHTHVTQRSGDYGVDIIAEKNGQKWAVQAKRYGNTVGQEAVREAVAGCTYYHCQRSMVVTTSRFTAHTKALARSNGTVLIDRDRLAEWIIAFQGSDTSR